MFEVAVVGSGPAGATCAAFCAAAGIRTVLLEREKFPREKVCGDCLNPSCTPVLERLGVAERVRALSHAALERVDFIGLSGRIVSVPLPRNAEIAVKRSLLDHLLMTRAVAAGAEVRDSVIVSAVTPPSSRSGGWTISAGGETVVARVLVAADGRNSTVARLLGMLPTSRKERIAIQTHVPLPKNFGNRVVLQFLRDGYSGQAPVGDDELNVCLVATARKMPAMRAWAQANFAVPPGQIWRTITPLRRKPIIPAVRRLFLVGDAARVVEPFTGEGIYYALRSGEIAAEAIQNLLAHGEEDEIARAFSTAHQTLYRGRLWVNRFARTAVLSPRVTSALLRTKVLHPRLLARLTAKIVAAAPPQSSS
jgi:geranylgeranyl reductase family protein